MSNEIQWMLNPFYVEGRFIWERFFSVRRKPPLLLRYTLVQGETVWNFLAGCVEFV